MDMYWYEVVLPRWAIRQDFPGYVLFNRHLACSHLPRFDVVFPGQIAVVNLHRFFFCFGGQVFVWLCMLWCQVPVLSYNLVS